VAGETAARNLWPDADPLGQKITLRWYDGSSASYTVVGVVQDTGEMEILPHDRLAGQLFTVLNPAKLRLAVVLVRTRPGVVAKPDRAAVGLPDYLARTNAHSTMYATLFDFMGIAIVIVSALGVAGVLWCVVVQRARDMAIRVAIGARRRDIVRVLMAEFLLPMSVGVGTGVFLGANFWIYCGHYLQGIPIFDPVTYVGAVGVFGGIGVVGVTIAGARAWRVAPARFL
jgi:putative ABC transport system permease protein